MGFSVTGEESTHQRNLDMVLKKDKLVVICEFKYDLKTPLKDLALKLLIRSKNMNITNPI